MKRTGTKGNPYVTASLRVTAEDSSLVVLAKPGDGLAEITESLRGRFGAERVLEVRHHD